MPLIFPAASIRRYTKIIARDLLHWLVIAALSLQLIAETQHRHDLAQQSQDCVACYVNAQASGDGPTVAPTLPLVVLVVVYFIAPCAYSFFYKPFRNHFLPLSQAPPQA